MIFRRIKCNEEYQVINCCFLADLELKFSTEIYIFIKRPKNLDFLYFLIDCFVQSSPEKANLMQNFCLWY